jgi:hypothetical protein
MDVQVFGVPDEARKSPLVDRFRETNQIDGMEYTHRPHPEEPCEARRLEGWTPARSRLWPSFETRAKALSSGRGLLMISI